MVFNQPHRTTAQLETPADGTQGVRPAQIVITGEYVLHFNGKKLHNFHNHLGFDVFNVSSNVDVPYSPVSLLNNFELIREPDPSNGKSMPYDDQLHFD